MKVYNRALDYTALALNEMANGKPVLAARLFAKACEESDLKAAIATLEASNKYAWTLQASAKDVSKKRLRASEGDALDEAEDEMGEPKVTATEEEEDLDQDPLEQVADVEDDVEDEVDTEETPAAQMAKVLATMHRRSK